MREDGVDVTFSNLKTLVGEKQLQIKKTVMPEYLFIFFENLPVKGSLNLICLIGS